MLMSKSDQEKHLRKFIETMPEPGALKTMGARTPWKNVRELEGKLFDETHADWKTYLDRLPEHPSGSGAILRMVRNPGRETLALCITILSWGGRDRINLRRLLKCDPEPLRDLSEKIRLANIRVVRPVKNLPN